MGPAAADDDTADHRDAHGRDEIIQGSGGLDDDGSLLYRTGLGHGDAMHLGDLDPDNPGLEVWCVHESREAAFGQELHDACGGSKQTPNLAGDLVGDWREEVITHDDEALYLTTTTIPTDFGFPTLPHDPVYRVGMSWQNTGYNQPPRLGFWLGAAAAAAPRPAVRAIKAAGMVFGVRPLDR
jgi:hypothetical protein